MEEVNIKELSNYCLNCLKKPCNQGCPLNNDTAGFIKLIKEDKLKEAYELLCETTVLSSICGRVCPHTKQCEGKCIRGIKGEPVSIGQMEFKVGDLAIKNNWELPKAKEETNKKVAIIGSGPSSLTCAAFLRRKGIQVTIYEKHNYLGGLLRHGIPEFRLPKKILDEIINKIIELNIEVKLNHELGKNIKLSELEKEYDAIYIGIGANKSTKLNIDGEDLPGVFGGNELLEYQNYPELKNKKVIVNGGGNVAMDVARTLKRLGSEVKVIYRRSENEMPAELKEVADAKIEGIEFIFLTNVLKINGTDKVTSIECIKTELKEEEGKRPYPVNLEGTNHYIECDYFIKAIGSTSEKKLFTENKIELTSKNKIKINEQNQTSNNKIFAGGDITEGTQTVAFAARSGRDAAESIIKYLEV